MRISLASRVANGLGGRPKLAGYNLMTNRAQFIYTRSRSRSVPNIIKVGTAGSNSLPARFTIQDGPSFLGRAFGANTNVSGEAVFTTSIVGYPESMTDPSYRGQILVFTQPLIGNYGVPSTERDQYNLLKYFESPHIQCSGIVVSDVALKYSHWTAVESLSEWLTREGIPAISGVDTREIVKFLREKGSSLGRISMGYKRSVDEDNSLISAGQIDFVSTKAPYVIESPGANLHVALVDTGVKENILRSLIARGTSVTVLPHNFPVHKVAHYFDGIFISNGPGDPTHYKETIFNLRCLMETSSLPIMGICLGHQLLALAVGAKTTKLKYGNRAHNIPALDLTTGQCHITSQNHGYVVDASTLPSEFDEYFINLNDGSNEGMIHKTRPIFSVQFHPEAKGGPMDTSYLFDKYLESVRLAKKNSKAVHKDKLDTKLLLDVMGHERMSVCRAEALTGSP